MDSPQNFKIPFLRKWRFQAAQAGDDIIITSAEMRHKSFSFWARASLSTWISWTSRFLMVNFLIYAITAGGGDHFDLCPSTCYVGHYAHKPYAGKQRCG